MLPLAVNEVTQVGLEAIAAAFAYGASAVRLLLRARPRHDVTGLRRTLALAEPILVGLGFGAGRVATIETDDPDILGETLRALEAAAPAPRPASFLAVGGKRDVMRLALRELQRAAPAPVDVIALPVGAPFGKVELDVEGCTLCLACVSACPTGALGDDPERPTLRFSEDACVQCGLCQATCPEKVITLVPQLDFRAATASARVLKQEEPFACIRCGKPFGTKSTIERVTAKLEGKHWMFQGSARRLDVLKMCADCRAIAVTEDKLDPYAAATRPNARTTEDYLREAQERARMEKGEGRLSAAFFLEIETMRRAPKLPHPNPQGREREAVLATLFRHRRLLQKLHQRGAVGGGADALLGHLGAGRVGGGAELEQFRHRLRRPHDGELLERVGEIVVRQGRDAAAENTGQRRTGAIALVGVQRMAGDAGAKHFRARIAGIGRERVLGRADHHVADRLAGDGVPAPDHAIGAAAEQRAAIRKERDRPHRQSRPDQRAREPARGAVDDGDRAADAGGGDQLAVAGNGQAR